MTADGRADYVGRQCLEYTGLSSEEAHGPGWLTALHRDDTPRVLSRWSEITQSGELGELEARMRRHDGEYRWFLFRACPMRDPGGMVQGLCVINLDIEDPIRAEAAAREQNQRFERIVDSLAEAQRLSHTGSFTGT